MKKIFILMVLMGTLMVTGCTSSQETTEKQEDTKVVYCNDCGEDSKEVTKFCSQCGVEAKWVAEKPKKTEETNNEKNDNELFTCLNCKKEISNLEKENLKGYCQDCVTCDQCDFIPDKIDSIKNYEFNFKTQLCNQCTLENSSKEKEDSSNNKITDEDIMESTDVRNNNYKGAPTTCTVCGSKNIHLERLGYYCYDCFASYNEDTKQFEE